MHNALIVTPETFKQQLIWRICYLLSSQKEQTFFLGDADIAWYEGVFPTAIFAKKGRELFVEWTDEDGGTATSNAKEFYIEDLWRIYMACEPIYQQRLVNYANFEG